MGKRAPSLVYYTNWSLAKEQRWHRAVPMSLWVARYLLRIHNNKVPAPYINPLHSLTSTAVPKLSPAASIHPQHPAPFPALSLVPHLGGGSLSSMAGPLSVSRAGLGRAAPGTLGSPLAEETKLLSLLGSSCCCWRFQGLVLSPRQDPSVGAACPSRTPRPAPGSLHKTSAPQTTSPRGGATAST